MIELQVHEFTMGDCDDFDIYVAQPIYEWQQTKKGKWCMENCTDLRYWNDPDPYTYGYRVRITGKLEEIKATEFKLRFI